MKGDAPMQYQKLSKPAKAYAEEFFSEYRERLRENIPDEVAAVIYFNPDVNTLPYIYELQKFFHFKVGQNQLIINHFFVDHMTCFYKW